jgi:hypothetical protein
MLTSFLFGCSVLNFFSRKVVSLLILYIYIEREIIVILSTKKSGFWQDLFLKNMKGGGGRTIKGVNLA